MKKFIVAGMVVFSVVIYLGIKMYASSVAEEKVNMAIAKFANHVDVDYGDVAADPFGLDVRMSDVLLSLPNSKDKIFIKEIVIHEADDQSDVPSFLDISLTGIEIDIKKLGNKAKDLLELGYGEKITLNFAVDYNYDKERGKINVDELKLGVNDVGELEVSFQLENIDLSPEKIAGIMFTYPQIMIHDAKISYRDDSLVARLIERAAKSQNKSVAQLKSEALRNIDRQIEEGGSEFIKTALGQVKNFISNPDEIAILIAPDKPMAVGRLLRTGNPGELIKLLNMEIKS